MENNVNKKMSCTSISINILHYNSYEKTEVCVNSCLKQVGDDIKIIIIDNFSTNDSLEKLKKTFGNIDNVSFLENKENYGFAKGNNIGIKYALEMGIEYTFLLNNDTELIGENLVAEMLDVIKKYSNCAVVAPQIYDVTQDGLVLLKNDSSYLKMLRFFKILPRNIIVSEQLESISEAQGSALFVNNKNFLGVKGFPEHYFMYGEEGTFSKKILWNKKILLWYKSKNNYVLHHHDKSKSVDDWRLYLMGRNRGIEFYENHKKRPLWGIVYLAFWMKCAFHYKKNYLYLVGMRKAHKLNVKKSNCEEYYFDGYMAKDRYGSKEK